MISESSFTQAGMAVTQWGDGALPRAVFVHGGGASGAANFRRQKALAERWTLLLPDRPGHGKTPLSGRQDFAADAPRIAELLGPGAHLVGHSYGGLIALLAAALRPEAVSSLTLIEPTAYRIALDHADVRRLVADLTDLFDHPPEPGQFLRRFLDLNGIPGAIPSPLPQRLADDVRNMVSIRRPWEAEIPLTALAHAALPTLIITGGHRQAFEDVADVLAGHLGARRVVLTGAGHNVQDTGDPFNTALEGFWLSTAENPSSRRGLA